MAATSTSDPPAPTRRQKKKKAKASASEASGAWYPRWYWPSFTVPGIVWLALLFLLPFFTVLSVAFGTVDPIFRQPLPVYQPWWWSFATFNETLSTFYRRRCHLPAGAHPHVRLRVSRRASSAW